MSGKYSESSASESIMDLAVAIVLEKDFSLAEIQSSLTAIILAVWIFNPGWEVFELYGAYRAFEVLPTWIISSILFFTGLLQLTALYSRRLHSRKIAAFVMSCVWSGFAIGFILSDFRVTASVTYFIFAVISGIIFLKYTMLIHIIMEKIDGRTFK